MPNSLTPVIVNQAKDHQGPSPVSNGKYIEALEQGIWGPHFRLPLKRGEGKLCLFAFCILPIAFCISPLDAFNFFYRLDSYQQFNQPGYVAKVFRRNQEFALVAPLGEFWKLNLGYHFTADVNGPNAVHQWSPLVAQLSLSPHTRLAAGGAFPYDRTLGQPATAWLEQELILEQTWTLALRGGFRQDRRGLLQPVLNWQCLPYLRIGINGGTMAEFLIDQAPQAEVLWAATGFPLQSALQWIHDQMVWKASLAESWPIH